MKCIIVDDEKNCIVALRELLHKYHPDVNIAAEFTSADEAYAFLSQPDNNSGLVFMDIQMPGCDGFSLLKKFEQINFNVIFTTAYDHYAIKAIKFSALDYLLKPIDPEELDAALQKYGTVLQTRKSALYMNDLNTRIHSGKFFDKLAVPSLSEIIFIPVEKIIYLESDNNYTLIHCVNGEQIVSSKNIGYYEELLNDLNFFRIHNSYIISLKKINRYIRGKTAMVELENGVTLQISTRRKEEFLEFLNLK